MSHSRKKHVRPKRKRQADYRRNRAAQTRKSSRVGERSDLEKARAVFNELKSGRGNVTQITCRRGS